jgi:glycosyltransferase involved in cell wall biosynthesis
MLSFTFPPDVGGVETHLTDLVSAINRRPDLAVKVCTYKPIVTAVRHYQPRERLANVDIRRWWWFGGMHGGNIFRSLEGSPSLLFLYVTPYFLTRAFLFMLIQHRNVDLIHVHGLNMAFVGWILGTVFRKPVIMQTHAIYSFQSGSWFACVARHVLCRMNAILTLSNASKRELLTIGVPPAIVGEFRYWIDLALFSPSEEPPAGPFSVVFVGRLIDIKGGAVVCRLAERLPDVQFAIIGDGPDRARIEAAAQRLPNLRWMGLIANQELPPIYRSAHVTIVPSQYPEGFGRVISESLACGTPVIASDVGGIRDAIDDTVGILSRPDEESMLEAVERLRHDRELYMQLRRQCRPYAERNCGLANAESILALYRP